MYSIPASKLLRLAAITKKAANMGNIPTSIKVTFGRMHGIVQQYADSFQEEELNPLILEYSDEGSTSIGPDSKRWLEFLKAMKTHPAYSQTIDTEGPTLALKKILDYEASSGNFFELTGEELAILQDCGLITSSE